MFTYHVLSEDNFVLGGEDGDIFQEKNLANILSHNTETIRNHQPPLLASHWRLTNGRQTAPSALPLLQGGTSGHFDGQRQNKSGGRNKDKVIGE